MQGLIGLFRLPVRYVGARHLSFAASRSAHPFRNGSAARDQIQHWPLQPYGAADVLAKSQCLEASPVHMSGFTKLAWHQEGHRNNAHPVGGMVKEKAQYKPLHASFFIQAFTSSQALREAGRSQQPFMLQTQCNRPGGQGSANGLIGKQQCCRHPNGIKHSQ